MKNLIWIIVLFAAAVGLAVAAGAYDGNVYIAVGQTLLRINLHTFVLGLILAVVVLYLLVRLIAGLLDLPGRIGRFRSRRQEKQAGSHLNAAGLAYFEGRYQKAAQEADKVLTGKNTGDNRTLALMLAAHAADAVDDTARRDGYLQEIAKLPGKSQLSRHLLQAEGALAARDYEAAARHMDDARRLNPGLTRLAKLDLRYALDHGDAAAVLEKAAKLKKAGAINGRELDQHQEWAYRRLLSLAADSDGVKAALKRIPDEQKSGGLCVAVAQKYEHLGMYGAAAAWVEKHYPQTRQEELLPVFARSVRYLDEKARRRAIDTADGWLKQHPDDAALLLHLGILAYGQGLWGKAQSYLEASLALRESVQARLVLAKVFDETGGHAKAEAQRRYAFDEAVQEEEQAAPAVLPDSR
ncbi:heme biosynthesis HemY N-terminal domain-containing protein [Neisseria leonii]|uniref:heme biosynthesis HemY N-terminal domain-containing protein n=1 Tax=Neisseria leonii TaxID=2995413 RepID=UPI00237B0C5A|nr:heme biosynthesis HemY N-terminal domain-containing protein [Neisseria sp. 3986]MDD9326695.1 heme biosynthesis protein HemY [Neisseria sp. 3986]